ncbi:MAG: radical SAM protein [bacterium]|nr:radical SAM protein [bacterium]
MKNIRMSYFARTALAILKKKQFILYHKPTTSCNCRCKFCDFWKNNPASPQTSTENVVKMLEEGQKEYLTTYSLWGGEPLIVKDLGVWLSHAKKLGYKTSLCTSGYLLEDRFHDINNFIDIILLSLEGVYEEQDKIRNTPGLFERIVRGLNVFQADSRVKIKIWSHINRLNRKSVLPILRFAKSRNLTVEFFPSNTFSDYNEDIIFAMKERYDIFSEIMLLKKTGWPVNNSIEALKLMRGDKNYRCNMARNGVHVDSQGVLTPCEARFAEKMLGYGDFQSDGFSKIHDPRIYNENVRNLEKCRNCLFPCIAESANNIYVRAWLRFADFAAGRDS